MKDGEVKIVNNNDGTYSITCDFTDEDGYTVKASWKGELEDYQNIEAPQTTLDSDVEMNPETCSRSQLLRRLSRKRNRKLCHRHGQWISGNSH